LTRGLDQLTSETEAIIFSSSEFSTDDEEICCESIKSDAMTSLVSRLQNILTDAVREYECFSEDNVMQLIVQYWDTIINWKIQSFSITMCLQELFRECLNLYITTDVGSISKYFTLSNEIFDLISSGNKEFLMHQQEIQLLIKKISSLWSILSLGRDHVQTKNSSHLYLNKIQAICNSTYSELENQSRSFYCVFDMSKIKNNIMTLSSVLEETFVSWISTSKITSVDPKEIKTLVYECTQLSLKGFDDLASFKWMDWSLQNKHWLEELSSVIKIFTQIYNHKFQTININLLLIFRV
jgi:hypothetical protein